MLHRFPRGVDGDKVHQKRLPSGAPPWVETVRVDFPSGRHADELCVTGLADVVWAVQMSTVEFHPWNSRRADVERPDEWRIDLDPMPECAFDTVRRVAHVAHEVLDELGADRLAEDLRRIGDPHLRPDRAAVGLRRRPPRRARVRARGRAPGPGSGDDDLVAQGPRARQGLRRLQPERSRPHDRERLLGAGGQGGTVSTPIAWDEIDDVVPQDCTIATVPGRFATLGDLHCRDRRRGVLAGQLLEWAERDERAGAQVTAAA